MPKVPTSLNVLTYNQKNNFRIIQCYNYQELLKYEDFTLPQLCCDLKTAIKTGQ